MPRFCPFCGLSNAPEYSFCNRCGKPLPPIANEPAGAPGFAPPPPPPDDAGDAADGPLVRPLTEAERAALKASRRARQGNMARAFGTLAGIAPLFLTFMGTMGTPFEPLNFQMIVVVGGFLALILGATSMRLRTPISLALKGGTVTEARGVPEKRPVAGSLVSVGFSGLDFLMPSRLAARIPDDRVASIAFILVGMGRTPHADRARALVLGVNGDASAPEEAYLAVPPEVAQSLRATSRAAMARKR